MFLISFLLGILYMYLSKPELKVIQISPTPDNCDKVLYRDQADTCYKYKAREVPCKEESSFFSIQ